MPPKTPRNISGKDLIKALSQLRYEVDRQKGSHARLRTHINGEHFITVAIHDSVPIGTLNAILNEVADHFGTSKSDLIERLF